MINNINYVYYMGTQVVLWYFIKVLYRMKVFRYLLFITMYFVSINVKYTKQTTHGKTPLKLCAQKLATPFSWRLNKALNYRKVSYFKHGYVSERMMVLSTELTQKTNFNIVLKLVTWSDAAVVSGGVWSGCRCISSCHTCSFSFPPQTTQSYYFWRSLSSCSPFVVSFNWIHFSLLSWGLDSLVRIGMAISCTWSYN